MRRTNVTGYRVFLTSFPGVHFKILFLQLAVSTSSQGGVDDMALFPGIISELGSSNFLNSLFLE